MVLQRPLWWSCIVLVAVAFALAGCDSPSPKFAGLTARQVTVDGSLFSVRYTRTEAEAVRISKEFGTRRGTIVGKGAKAIVIASGCAIKSRTLDGDTVYVRAKIDCAEAPG
ncbi:MAG: hypothetical protein QNJ16_12105 [Rhodobacter sp.]|nr:hypothetical protein [Rhodobacter sp.]